jgi:hypothetical protein
VRACAFQCGLVRVEHQAGIVPSRHNGVQPTGRPSRVRTRVCVIRRARAGAARQDCPQLRQRGRRPPPAAVRPGVRVRTRARVRVRVRVFVEPTQQRCNSGRRLAPSVLVCFEVSGACACACACACEWLTKIRTVQLTTLSLVAMNRLNN